MAASVRQAVIGMDLSGISAHRIQVVVSGIAHNGGGRDRFPGVTSGSIGMGMQFDNSSAEGDRAVGATGTPWVDDWRNSSDHTGMSPNASVSARFEHEYDSFQSWTDADLQYLEQVIRMRLIHLGIVPTDANPEMRLRVLVDVLGTNRSRDEWILASKDVLEASCELTWYVTAEDDAKLVQAAKRSGASASYSESGMILVSGLSRHREVTSGTLGEFATPTAQ